MVGIMIRLENVSLQFPGGITALHPTYLDFKAGQFTVLLGASGAGKSSLIRCLNLLQRPSTGVVLVEGLGEVSQPQVVLRHRRQTAMIFQQHQLIGRHTAWQNVLMGRLAFYSTVRSLFPLPRRDQVLALECLDRVGLLNKALERVDSLSGGEQQRVGIARALAQQPRLILADEPVASLDPIAATKILDLLQEVCKNDGITTIVSLHQVDLALQYADRIVALARGKIVFDGSPDELDHLRLEAIYQAGTYMVPDRPFRREIFGSSLNFATMED